MTGELGKGHVEGRGCVGERRRAGEEGREKGW